MKLKETLLKYNFIDNVYLDEYVDLMLNNYGTKLKKGCTQKHHVVPVSCYFNDSLDFTSHRIEALQIASSDDNNYIVNLSYSDHLKAHTLLCKCSESIIQIISNAKACDLMLRTLRPALDAGIVPDLLSAENQQTAYEYVRSNTPVSSGSFKPKTPKTKYVDPTTGTTRRKVRCIETGVIYNSIKEAEIANGLAKSRLNSILTGYRKQIPGMTFEYYNETAEISEVSE